MNGRTPLHLPQASSHDNVKLHYTFATTPGWVSPKDLAAGSLVGGVQTTGAIQNGNLQGSLSTSRVRLYNMLTSKQLAILFDTYLRPHDGHTKRPCKWWGSGVDGHCLTVAPVLTSHHLPPQATNVKREFERCLLTRSTDPKQSLEIIKREPLLGSMTGAAWVS